MASAERSASGEGALRHPPQPHNEDAQARKVGVELEFADLTPHATARCVQARFGGNIVAHSAHLFTVKDSALGGDIEIELDSRFAQPSFYDGDEKIADAVGRASSFIVPTEIGLPPISYERLPELSPFLDDLRRAGASGTFGAPHYAFGVHLNIEIPSAAVADTYRIFRAYLLKAEWLRENIDIDPTRWASGFIQRFPDRYLAHIMRHAGMATWRRFAIGYLTANPSRSRELDMLPIFAHFCPDLVERRLPKEKIKARPTFHYRLPNMNLEDPDWTLVAEWNRWVEIETLAADPAALAQAAQNLLGTLTNESLLDYLTSRIGP